ncbi:predicted protein [Histoplasma mississippiense (nom. inval.)]|uniref:predicted protein n=1 Tax=Ajellomyces capsulatus (strain NAm1 / WU24) TaxID=2059318 RepID=UPI000157D012|nr:predicted protein [Histoplasma mississippiense (nom. inval.)]EDN11009.1 predicted protein [Histoplasma mississippiense (nom. inval.)]
MLSKEDYILFSELSEAFKLLTHQTCKKKDVQVFAASMADIKKMLEKLEFKNFKKLHKKLFESYKNFTDVFDEKAAENLPSH